MTASASVFIGVGLIIRFLLSLGPSYIHPDEHFQGPEQLAGPIFGWSSQKTWEFASERPLRSILPLYVAYGFPMYTVKFLVGNDNPTPVFYGLRIWMFGLSLLSDYGVYCLFARKNKNVRVLLATCYVTATYQCHTFSNSIEILVLVWFALLVKKTLTLTSKARIFAVPFFLGGLLVFGTFNRITFPAFLIFPGIYFVPQLVLTAPLIFWLASLVGALVVCGLAVKFDSTFYGHPHVFTIINNLVYNTDTRNLEAHGLHPRYTHLFINLPQLLGPALVGLWKCPIDTIGSKISLLTCISGVIVLSIVPHQEARFLIPIVPLILGLFSLRRYKRLFMTCWIIFNLILGILMGVLHQGGVVPAQMHLHSSNNNNSTTNMVNIWWNTYPPPLWLLGSRHAKSITLVQHGLWSHVDIHGDIHQSDNLTNLLIDSTTDDSLLVVDLMGSSPDKFKLVLHDIHNITNNLQIITPLRNSPHVPSSYNYTLQWSYYPHIDMDNLFDDNMKLNKLGIGIFS